jgi:uncharacterized protein YcnI
MRKLLVALAAVSTLVFTSSAFAHAHVSPPVSLAKQTQSYTLAVPTEEEGKTTTKIVLTVPKGFSIDSFTPSPGWTRSVQATGSGEDAVIQKVTWTGGKVPTDEDSTFQFLAQPASTGRYSFQVQQTYSDGKVVNWSGPESSETPSPTIEAQSSLGGGGTSTIAIIALALAAVAAILALVGLLARGGGGGGRQLA